MNGFAFWRAWLLVAALVMVAFGVFLSFLIGMPLFDAFSQQFNAPFWGSGPLTDAELGYQRWVNGVMGATMIGWGIFLLFIARHPFAKKEPWAWYCILVGVAAWFAVDTGISLYQGVYANALLNTALLILVMVPLAFTRGDFRQ